MQTLATTIPAAAPALTGLIPVCLLLVTGLILWAAGRRVLKAGFAAAGLLLGAMAGWVLADVLDLGVPPWLIAAVLGVVCASVAALAYRVPVAAAMGVVCGLASAMAVVTAGELHDHRRGATAIEVTDPEYAPDDPAADPATDPAADFMRDTAQVLDDASDWLMRRANPDPDGPEGPMPPVPSMPEGAAESIAQEAMSGVFDRLGERHQERVEQARGWMSEQIDAVRAWWEAIPASRHPTIATAGAVGAIVGLLVGTLVPGASSTLVTGFGGAFLWLGTLRIVLIRIGDETLEAFLPDTTALALVLWLVISLIGVAIQWTFRAKPTDKPG